MHRLREAMRTGGLAPAGRRRQGRRGRRNLHRQGRSRASQAAQGRPYKRRGHRQQAPDPRAGRARRQRPLVPCRRSPIADTVAKIVRENIARESRLHHRRKQALHRSVGTEFAATRPSTTAPRNTCAATFTTNTVEGYFSIFKRGMRGVYQHCSEKHLHRYLAEFDFRYNNRTALGVNDGDARPKLAAWHRRQAPHLSTA